MGNHPSFTPSMIWAVNPSTNTGIDTTIVVEISTRLSMKRPASEPGHHAGQDADQDLEAERGEPELDGDREPLLEDLGDLAAPEALAEVALDQVPHVLAVLDQEAGR